MFNRFESFTGSVLELSRCVQKIKELEMKPLGLKAGHVMCLYYLGKNHQGLTVTELAEVCREDKAAISRCVAELVKRGLVSGDFPEDKRSYRTKLFLTPQGQALTQEVYQRIDRAVIGGGEGLSQQQRETLYTAMNIIIENLARYIADREE